ncbi:MAG: rhodanese-like domain-containing protein [Syntrophales bacterium]|nr:rhodanese-like domain-containing protein [Syntrophales bacterium]
MKTAKLCNILIIIMLMSLPAAALAQALNPIATTDEVAKNLSNKKLVMVDIRKVEEYKAGHIPGAVNVFYNNWAPGRGGLQNEMPLDDDLMDLLTSVGLQPDTIVLVYGKTETAPDRVNVTRVAWALRYAGVKKVSVLSGGFEKWTSEKKAVSMDVVKPKGKSYKGKFNRNFLVGKDYVMKKIGVATIVDTREPAFFSGQQKLPFVPKPGHIKSAVNLPTAQVFDKNDPGGFWIYKDPAALKAMALAVVGSDLSREIIVYCDSGRFASAWWFILTEVLGYKNVENYDGAMEDWTKDPKAPIEPQPVLPEGKDKK